DHSAQTVRIRSHTGHRFRERSRPGRAFRPVRRRACRCRPGPAGRAQGWSCAASACAPTMGRTSPRPSPRPTSDRMNCTMALRVAVFGENRHEKVDRTVQEIYPEGMHTTIAEGLRSVLAADGVEAEVRIALLDDIEESLSEE